MKIPEEWKLVPVEPTEEMLAATDSPDQHAYNNYIAMVQAAPTPTTGYLVTYPTGDTTFFERLPECLPPECMVQEQRLAQEVEPVAWLIECTVRGIKTKDVYRHNAIGDFRAIDPNAVSTPLYTHAVDDKLRKAAEEALRILDQLGSGPTAENLRAALEGK